MSIIGTKIDVIDDLKNNRQKERDAIGNFLFSNDSVKMLAAPDDKKKLLSEIGLDHGFRAIQEIQQEVMERSKLEEEVSDDLYSGNEIYDLIRDYNLVITKFKSYKGYVSMDLTDKIYDYFIKNKYGSTESNNMYIVSSKHAIDKGKKECPFVIIHKVSNRNDQTETYWRIVYKSPKLFSFFQYVKGMIFKSSLSLGITNAIIVFVIAWIVKMSLVTPAFNIWFFIIFTVIGAGITLIWAAGKENNDRSDGGISWDYKREYRGKYSDQLKRHHY